ncbi:uncharacterized protein J8A68_005856 [[Candida] subhashii]|uniref:PWWP domain-containing protein n=1 Tax=[Candida] subhashii TaxID=561895 RepID=A0A8J5USE8_9ASCO|nr:uncharacterized protein J8A68_005856 [[Candida] subhashii]KAG7660590.1 hypothetical protein J8A68_005856 [[Candida] subhashii]
MSDDQFPPTTVVLAKVKGYPAWPAMVLEESKLPDHILSKKPKTKSSSSSTTPSSPKKKSTIPAHILPVRFFSDDTYIWINSHDIKLLTKDAIQNFFTDSNKKRRRDNLLQKAYELANDPPDMELFIQYGSRAAPPTPEPEPEPVEEEEEEEEVEVDETPKKRKKPGPKPKEKGKAGPKPKDKAKPGPKPKGKAKPGPKPKQTPVVDPKKIEADRKKQEEKKLLSEYDDDWGLELVEYDSKSGNYIFDSKREQIEFFNELPDSITIQTNLEKLSHKFQQIEQKLIPLLLLLSDDDEGVDESDVLTQLKLLDALLNSLPKSVISKSKILRALILTKRKGSGEFGQVKQRIDKILKKLDIEVRENTAEELISQESKAATPDIKDEVKVVDRNENGIKEETKDDGHEESKEDVKDESK